MAIIFGFWALGISYGVETLFKRTKNVESYLFEPIPIISMFIGGMLPFFIFRKKWQPKPGTYTALDELLHYVYLSSSSIPKMSFAIEKMLFKVKLKKPYPKSLLITGLARSGTTALTSLLYKTEAFSSLYYRNMPFVLMPNFWVKVNRGQSVSFERSHADGIEHSLESVEALEEFFWKTYLGKSYINIDTLNTHEIPIKVWNEYQKYLQLILVGDKYYLAKNNNSILRLKSLLQHDNQLQVVILFRHPAAHIKSLESQNSKFKEQQDENEFVDFYMEALAHHEFGNKWRPFQFTEQTPARNYKSSWFNYYSYSLQFAQHERVHFVSQEGFASNPKQTLEVIKEKTGLEFQIQKTDGFKLNDNSDELSPEIIDVYERLCQLKIN
ncbi:MAG: sulfotransferase [Bacteroidetes bacterium]|nr:sulfotransferase [Bacteroidota bacterium]